MSTRATPSDDPRAPRELEKLHRTWERLARVDQLRSILARGENWDEDEFFATGEREIGEVTRYLRELGLPARWDRALDFGCGVGRLSRALAAHFAAVLGVDLSESMIEDARQLNADYPNCEFKHNRRPDLSALEPCSFDLIYSNITLQHMPPDLAKGYMAEFLRVVAPDGLVLFQLTARRHAGSRRVRRKLARLSKPPAENLKLLTNRALGRRMEMHCIPKDDVVAFLEAHGGEVIDVLPDELPGYDSYRYAVIPSRQT
jgi:SAM-dependent methyltransferase